MAETKLTVKPNNIVVYETFEGNTPLEVREVTNNDFSNSLPLDGDTDDKYTKHRYYYLNISWDDTDLLDLAGKNYGLHKLKTDPIVDKQTYHPSVFPKKFDPRLYTELPDYLEKGKNKAGNNDLYDGYTLLSARVKYNTVNKIGNLYAGDNKNLVEEISVDGASFDYDCGEHYYDEYVVETDKNIFKTETSFDSSDYIKDYNQNTYKLVYKPSEYLSKHKLTCYTYNDNDANDLYFYDEEKGYVPLTPDIRPGVPEDETKCSYSIVTFIPQKNPSNAMSDSSSNVNIEWVLCEFCRGIASSTKEEEVNIDTKPARVKCEWRPLVNKNGQTIVLTSLEVNNFFTTYIPCENKHDYTPTDSQIPIDEDGNFQSVEVKSYNIMEDDIFFNPDQDTVKIFVDFRKDEDESKNIHLQIENRNEDTYVTTVDKFYSDRENKIFTENDYILLDSEGYPLYSPELLIKFGIGFLKASWVFYKDGYGLMAKLSASDLPISWYLQGDVRTNYDVFNNDGTLKPDIITGKIYSTKYILSDVYKKHISSQDPGYDKLLNVYYGYKNEMPYNEEIIYDYGNILGGNQLLIQTETGSSDTNQINSIYTSRQILYNNGIGIQTMSKNSNNVWEPKTDSQDIAILRVNQSGSTPPIYEFITWIKNANIQDIVSHSYTVRYRIDYSYLSNEYNLGPEYKNFAFWVPNDNNEEVLTTIDNYSNVNSVKTINPETGEEKPLIKEIKYIITYTLTSDIYPINSIGIKLPDTWTYAQNYKQAFLNSHEINIKSISTKSNISAEEYLDDQVKTYKYLTPNEYYSTTYIDEDEPQQNWFWLDSISNWCRYELSSDNQTIVLKLWNGLGSWDSIIDILYTSSKRDYNKLLKQYLYDNNFFSTGAYYPTYPGMKKEAYEPLVAKFPADCYHEQIESRGIIEYNTLILPRDNVSILYKNNMSNTDDLIYYNNDYNDYAREFYHEAPDTVAINRRRNPDETRRFAVGITTQYCPCVFKLRNGNLAISNYFVAHTSNDKGLYRNVLSAEEANNRCKTIFGDGSNKTIEDDWKRYYRTDDTEEIKSDLRNMNDETLYGSASLIQANAASTINKITIVAMRPNPTTNNRVIQDYLERWDK